MSVFSLEKHVKYFQYHLQCVPAPYISLDSSRLTILYFCLSGLDILNKLELTEFQRESICSFVYSLQVVPDNQDVSRCGFRGSPFVGCCFSHAGSKSMNEFDEAHIAQTYTALCTLAICGDDFRRLNKEAIIKSLKFLQESDGSFRSMRIGGENDLRFVFCAFAISSMLNDWSGFDVEKSVDLIRRCQSWDGGIGLGENLEGHGGSTYCGVACLYLVNRLPVLNIETLEKWCVSRQGAGFSGRPNKPADSCYSFWIGSTMKMLNIYHLSNSVATSSERKELVQDNLSHILSCQGKSGGFSKLTGTTADILHSYFAIGGLSVLNEETKQVALTEDKNLSTLKEIYPPWNLSITAKNHINKIFHK